MVKYHVMAMNESDVDFKQVFIDGDRELEIVVDTTRNAFDTWQKLLLAVGDNAGVLMEDDIILSRNFIEDIENAIGTRPDEMISFFTMKTIDGITQKLGSTYCMNQCYYLPKGMAKEIYDYSVKWLESPRGIEHPTGLDLCIADYLQANKTKYWLWYPCLVQHKAEPSRISGRSTKRQTKYFIDDLYPAITFDITVMACEPRREHVEEMVEDIGYPVDVFYDDRPQPRFGTSYTQLKCLNKPYEDEITHRVILQDDIEVVDGFVEQVQQLINKNPNVIYTLFCSRLHPVDMETGANYVVIGGYNTWGQANVIPVKYIERMLQFRDKYLPNYPFDDALYHHFGKKYSIPILTTMPSLVQHLEPTTSLLGFNNKNKISKVWIGKDTSDIDWANGSSMYKSMPPSNDFETEMQMCKNFNEGKGWVK